MSYFVYLISTKRKNKIITYVGYTKDLIKRLSLHNLGKGAKFTRGRKWKLIYKEKFSSKNQAISRESAMFSNKIFGKFSAYSYYFSHSTYC